MAGDPIKDRSGTTDQIADWMHKHYPSWTIDTLLCHGDLAIAMCLAIASKSGRIKRGDATKLSKALNVISEIETETGFIYEILRTALASRKRGDLKPDKH